MVCTYRKVCMSADHDRMNLTNAINVYLLSLILVENKRSIVVNMLAQDSLMAKSPSQQRRHHLPVNFARLPGVCACVRERSLACVSVHTTSDHKLRKLESRRLAK